MARLVAVYREEEYEFDRRQIPLVIDETLTMVMEFQDGGFSMDYHNVKQKELDSFHQKLDVLSKDELAVELMVTSKQLFRALSQLVPCVGCRRSVERLFNQLVESGHPAIEPLIVTPHSVLSIKHAYLFDPRSVYTLFYVHGARLQDVMESIPKSSKKNNRCLLHSLDTHKAKLTGSWIDVWELLSQDCRDEVVLINCESLLETMETYLRKHRFCTECKSKVLRAYSLLTGDIDSTNEKGYCATLYEGLRCCPHERHIHVSGETDFIAHLIGRAEPELAGRFSSSRRERHAKTIDIAQEEVLTCLGIHLYERLHRIWQKLRAEEQTWEMLFYVGVDTLRKSFEMAVEQKQGFTQLEQLCLEIKEEERARELKQEKKRLKRKKRKNKNAAGDRDGEKAEEKVTCTGEEEKENCKCNDVDVNSSCTANGGCSTFGATYDLPSDDDVASSTCSCPSNRLHPSSSKGNSCRSYRSDCGYSSGVEGSESLSGHSSRDGSDIACSEGICNHGSIGDISGEPCSHCEELDDPGCSDCQSNSSSGSSPTSKIASKKAQGKKAKKKASEKKSGESKAGPGVVNGERRMPPPSSAPPSSLGWQSSLQDMLEESCPSEDEDFISEEDIQLFKANQKHLDKEREKLRETLRKRFDSFQRRELGGKACAENASAK
ncbi:gametogenetin-binding protein 2-like isoform X1 [Branchiostoma lanceolatum]|uniref:gametogenetin-binding protein 2-like isoform X1 n=1 Tax=Branchiostoma lanceolatum TaxID=7740 RepID=UPI0034517EFA